MIHIEQNQIVPENPHLKVLSVSGDYADNDLIECATLDNPDFALCAFSATFIRYGGLAHQFSDPLKLGEALLAVDPESTHDAVTLFKEEEARRIKREGGDFTPENPVPADESISQITQEEIKEEEKKEEVVEEKETPKQDESAPAGNETPKGEVLGDVTTPTETPTDTPTTTPTTETPSDTTSTSTPPVEEPVTPITPTPEVVPVTQTPPQAPAPEPVPEVPVEESMQGPVETLIESISNGLSTQE